MKSFKESQTELYSLLRQSARHSFFLHCSRTATSLWVSDILRQNPQFSSDALLPYGYEADLSNDGLLYFRFTPERWPFQLALLPDCEPIFTGSALGSELFALSRLLLSHPHDASETDLQLLTSIYRLQALPYDQCFKETKKCIHTAAVMLRQGKLRCSPGGQLLALWLQKGVLS